MVCARVMRGTSSIASALTPRAASAWISSGRSSGRRNEMTSAFGGSAAISSSRGGATRSTTSAPTRAVAASGTSSAPASA